MVLEVEVADPTVGQNDVGIEDFARHGVNSTRADGRTNIVVEPADEVVLDVFWVQIHRRRGAWVLVKNLDRIGVTDLLEGLVPVLDTLLDPTAVSHGRGVFDVESDRGHRRANLQTRIPLLQSPTGHVSDPFLVVVVAAQVGEVGHKVSDALIGFARTVPGVFWNFAKRVVDRLKFATGSDHFEGQLGVPCERLGLDHLGQIRVLDPNARTEEFACISDEQSIRIDDRTTLRCHRHDGDIQ